MRKASNNEIKLLRKLGQKKYMEKEQQFIVEGERAVKQMVLNGWIECREFKCGACFFDSHMENTKRETCLNI